MRDPNLRYFCFTILLGGSMACQAWVYPEHREIALLAIEHLSPADRSTLDRMWMQARMGHELRLSGPVIDRQLGVRAERLDLASWTAIAGDHSCSPLDLMAVVLYSDWILKVDDVAARLRIDLAKAQRMDRTINAIRNSDIRFQRKDPDYATRAGSNNVHFLLERNEGEDRGAQYLRKCLQEGVPLNALGAYAYFHTRALERVAQGARPDLSEEERSALMLAALANEAFALHFLEDAFAAGHAVGSWGNAAQRKGTHDHYNEAGLEAVTWNGDRVVLTGDAHMRPQDAALAAEAVLLSLEQLCAAMERGAGEDTAPITDQRPDTFNVCTGTTLPRLAMDMEQLQAVLRTTPVPGLSEGLGEMTRFRAELGPFVGASSSLAGSALSGGFGPDQTEQGGMGSLEANAMFGIGLDGVLNKSGDALAFVQFGWRQDSPTSSQFVPTTTTYTGSTATATISGRSAYNIRVRLPFWLFPGDLLVGAPILSWAAPKTFQRMAVGAANGGLIPWQSGISTPVGRFQLVLGREVGVSLYGRGRLQETLLIPAGPSQQFYLVSYRSTKWDFPFLEYQPTRTFSSNQSASLKVQFSFGVDVPSKVETLSPDQALTIELQEVWYLGFRVVFDWRRYL